MSIAIDFLKNPEKSGFFVKFLDFSALIWIFQDYFSDFSKILQNPLLFSRFLKICLGKTLYISFLFNDAPNGGGKLIDVAFGIKNAEADTGGTAVGGAQRSMWEWSAMVSRAKAEALFR